MTTELLRNALEDLQLGNASIPAFDDSLSLLFSESVL